MLSMAEEALITNFMEEMRSVVKNAFKPIHERLDRLTHSRMRERPNLFHPITSSKPIDERRDIL